MVTIHQQPDPRVWRPSREYPVRPFSQDEPDIQSQGAADGTVVTGFGVGVGRYDPLKSGRGSISGGAFGPLRRVRVRVEPMWRGVLRSWVTVLLAASGVHGIGFSLVRREKATPGFGQGTRAGEVS